MDLELSVPEGSNAVVYIPSIHQDIAIDGNKATSDKEEGNFTLYQIGEGDHHIRAN